MTFLGRRAGVCETFLYELIWPFGILGVLAAASLQLLVFLLLVIWYSWAPGSGPHAVSNLLIPKINMS